MIRATLCTALIAIVAAAPARAQSTGTIQGTASARQVQLAVKAMF